MPAAPAPPPSRAGSHPGALHLRPDRLDGPVARQLVAAVQAEYVQRYGGPDTTLLRPDEFSLPRGAFFVAELGGEVVGCGGFRRRPDGAVELKRMYVVPAARRRGVARQLLHALEDAARRSGASRVVLETGQRQPEALAMYAAEGYVETTPFGAYADAPEAHHLAKDL